MPNLKADLSGTFGAAEIAPTSLTVVRDGETDELEVTSVTIAANSVVLLTASVPVGLVTSNVDQSCFMQFHRDGSPIGPKMTPLHKDNVDEGQNGSLMFADEPGSGTYTYAVYWQKQSASQPVLDTGRTYSIQIIELLSAEATLIDTSSSTAADTAPAGFADIDDMVHTYTPASADSVTLMILNFTGDFTGNSDETADFSPAVGGTLEGPRGTHVYHDFTDVGCSGSQAWATTGQSVSTAFSYQWDARGGTLATHGSLARYFQLIELLSTDRKISVEGTGSGTAGAYAAVTELDPAGVPVCCFTPRQVLQALGETSNLIGQLARARLLLMLAAAVIIPYKFLNVR